MDYEKVLQNKKLEMYANLAVGLVLLGSGIFFSVSKMALTINAKAVVGFSFIPLAAAFGTAYYLRTLQKRPQELRSMMIEMSDERLAAARNEADAIAHRIISWLLRLAFFGYILIVPSETFETVGWWMVFCLFLLSYFLPEIVLWFKGRQKEE